MIWPPLAHAQKARIRFEPGTPTKSKIVNEQIQFAQGVAALEGETVSIQWRGKEMRGEGQRYPSSGDRGRPVCRTSLSESVAETDRAGRPVA